MDLEKILVGVPDLTLMRLERDTLALDVKTLKSNLISLTGHQMDTRVGREFRGKTSQILQAIPSKIEQPPLDSTEKKQPPPLELKTSSSESLVGERSSPQPEAKPHLKMPSILVQSEFWRSSQVAQIDEEQRRAILESQRSDRQAMSRNKRMFGMLMGTLQRFRAEECHREQITKKRSKIEEKLESAVEEERASVSKEVARIIQLKRSKEDLLNKIDLKIDLVERFKNWDKSHRHLLHFLRTETKPKIYWLPKEHVPGTEKKQKDIKDYWSICYAEKTAKFKKDMEEVEKNIKEFTELHSKLIENNNISECELILATE